MQLPWQAVVVIVAISWLLMAAHTAWSMSRHGRRFWVWFIVSVLFSVVPATVVAFYDYFRSLRRRGNDQSAEPTVRCRHCGAVFPEDQLRRKAGQPVCPRCGMKIDDEHFA